MWPMDVGFFLVVNLHHVSFITILMSIQHQHLKTGRLHIKIRICDFSFKKLDHLVTPTTPAPRGNHGLKLSSTAPLRGRCLFPVKSGPTTSHYPRWADAPYL